MKKTPPLSSSKIFWILAGLGVVIYSNTFKFSFVFDDFQAIVNNPSIRSLDLIALWHAFNTRFVVGVSLALNYALGQDNVMGYHLFNTLIHILNALLVYKLVCLMPKTSKLLGFLVALIFLTHPLQTQGVTYIWQRATSLASFFYLGGLLFYIRGRIKASYKEYGLCLLFTVLGMFTKEIVFTLPFAIALYEFIFLREIPLKTKQKMLLWIPLALTLLIIPWTMTQSSSETLKFLKLNDVHFRSGQKVDLVKDLLSMTRTSSPDKMPRQEFILTELNVLRTYLRLFVLPVNQSVDYDYPKARSLLEPNTLLSFILLVGLFGAGCLFLKKHPLLAFGIFWFFLTVSVESLVAQEEFIFEHRLYLPLVGLSLFLVTTLSYFLKTPKRLAWVILGIAACFSFMTYQRNFVWKDEFTLWDNAIKKAPKKGRPYNNRGYAYEKMGLFDKALQDSNKVIEIDPKATGGYNNRGLSYKSKGDVDRALSDFSKAIELQPDNGEAYSNRGAVYEKKGRLDEALEDYSKSIQISPYMANAYSNRSIVYKKKGLLEKALADCNKAIELEPHNAGAYSNRALIYENKGLLDLAIADCNKAIKLNDKMASAYMNRGVVYKKQNLLNQSLNEFNKAISLEPNNAEAYSNRAALYRDKGLLDQAIADCTKAIKISPMLASAYMNRGVSYRDKGQLDAAVADLNRAIELEPNNADAYNNRASAYGMQGLLEPALNDANKALLLNPAFSEAYNNRAILYKKKGLLDLALADCNKAIELNPSFAIAYVNRGSVYGTKGLMNEAIADYTKAKALGYPVNPQFLEDLRAAS